ncbi:coiled-coil domain-containing protein 66-like isoform X2 [Cylas formicarius]|uniref:coiled-coil domain-containing protein 66-like isoform X2 n=1 Tax=Cylas formicarius TaxID=197179 RepID=UPI0029586183|nr:coiled-coil domain-containing protein 66-like isoform X2 [Cylas formicarius]
MTASRALSLVERKKLQWAKERELARLGAPWGPAASRRGSLPPLHKNQFSSSGGCDGGGETSGYGSDNNPTPETGRGYESSSSCRDDRPRWGDKAKFWRAPDDHKASEPPNWVKRGLQDGAIVVANSSPSVSPEQRYEECDRPGTSSTFSNHRTYIRGQNIPLDALELAERERRRQMALAHQEAIRQQLEERERRRREERERREKEEREEEMRIERERENDRLRKLEEERALQEKLQRERKRKEALSEAVEVAEKEAKLEKMRLRLRKIEDAEEVGKATVADVKEEDAAKPASPADEIINNLQETSDNALAKSSPRRNSTPVISTPRVDNNFAFVMHPSLENLQYALLIPATPQLPIAIPMSIPTTARTIDTRVLTPTRFRTKCDSSTQTDLSISSARSSSETNDCCREKYLREKLTNLELSYERSRKGRRSRSESTEERPKWGVNRPPTRYLKQSEKDPLYQRRKLRQKQRRESEKNSSDESQTGTPKSYRKKIHGRAKWRTREEMFTRNVEMYQLEADGDRIYYKCCCRCKCRRRDCADVLKIAEGSPRGGCDVDADNKVDILSKLSSLRSGLLLERERWENSPRSPAATHRD